MVALWVLVLARRRIGGHALGRARPGCTASQATILGAVIGKFGPSEDIRLVCCRLGGSCCCSSLGTTTISSGGGSDSFVCALGRSVTGAITATTPSARALGTARCPYTTRFASSSHLMLLPFIFICHPVSRRLQFF